LQGPHENYSFITADNYIILEVLSPFTLYSFFAAARTVKGLGPSSVLFFYTDESGKLESTFLQKILLFWCLISLSKDQNGK
jgi:receptor-type tyrosine-protein phosphatase Q